VDATLGILREEHSPRVVRDAGVVDAAKEFSPEWQPAVLAREGELDKVEERIDREIIANRQKSFRLPDMPAHVILQPAPNLP
jgi:hypothetical protein